MNKPFKKRFFKEFMEKIKIFQGKKIKISKLSNRDLKRVKNFQDCINSLIKEQVQIGRNKKISLKQEKEWLKAQLIGIKAKRTVFLKAQDNNKIIGNININLSKERQNHVGTFGITIRKGYRGIGIGNYLMKEIMKLAKKELKPKPKIIRLSVFSTNRAAIKLYKKYGFKKAAKIPDQFNYKGKLISEIVMLCYLK